MMKWRASRTFDGSDLPKTGIDEGDQSSRPLVRISQSLSQGNLVHPAYFFP
jgi:hypothetical protein